MLPVPASAATPPPGGYEKVDKMDAEEARHVKAQFLIHKVLEEATASAASAAAASATATAMRSSRRPPPALVRVKARIGVRLKKLRLAIRGVRVRARRAVQRHLRTLRRLIARHGGGRRGGRRGSSTVKPAAEPP